MLNTHIYQNSPPTCFGVCYTIITETFALIAQKLYVFRNVVNSVHFFEQVTQWSP